VRTQKNILVVRKKRKSGCEVGTDRSRRKNSLVLADLPGCRGGPEKGNHPFESHPLQGKLPLCRKSSGRDAGGLGVRDLTLLGKILQVLRKLQRGKEGLESSEVNRIGPRP